MSGFERRMVNFRTESRARRVLAQLGAGLDVPPDARILEVGAGRGGLTALLQERFHPARLVGTDFDPAQVEAAREFLASRWGSIPANVELQAVDALRIPFADGSFDLVFAMMMLHHVEERHDEYRRRPEALREIQRVLRPGGTLVYSEIFRRADLRATLRELRFVPLVERLGWRKDVRILRAPA
jgi:ubiquinone/menaquinone biosynthesis C-methylase UbiE